MKIPKRAEDIFWVQYWDTNKESDIEEVEKLLSNYKSRKDELVNNKTSTIEINMCSENIAYLELVLDVMRNPGDYKPTIYIPEV